MHVSEISKEKIKTPVGQYHVGNSLNAKVININTEERRIGLSIKQLEMEDDQSILEDYVNQMKPAPSSLGEILKENLQEKFNSENSAAAEAQEAADSAAEGEPAEDAEPAVAEDTSFAAPADAPEENDISQAASDAEEPPEKDPEEDV